MLLRVLEYEALIGETAVFEPFVNNCSGHSSEIVESRMKKTRHHTIDECLLIHVVAFECGKNVPRDVCFPNQIHPGLPQTAPPLFKGTVLAEIRVKEVPARLQDSLYFGKELFEIRITMRRLDVDHSINRTCIHGKMLGIADAKFKPVDVVNSATEFNGMRREIDSNHVRWRQVSFHK